MEGRIRRAHLNMNPIGSAVFAGVAVLVAGAAGALFYSVSNLSAVEFKRSDASEQSLAAASPPKVEHIRTPQAVRGVYLSQCAAASTKLRAEVLDLADSTEVNAIIVDLKDFTGTVVFSSKTAIEGGSGCTVGDFREFVKDMHARGIYVIGRMTVFQDPLYSRTHSGYSVQSLSATAAGATEFNAVWKDHKGLSFVDVGARPFWDYIVTLSKEAHALGVDEINYDYIRYPSDGNMRDVLYLHGKGDKPEELERFFRHLSQEMKQIDGEHTPVLSADLFGITTTNSSDFSIGQVLERAMPYFDYIAPMVYPSHYPPGFNGWADPNKYVYEVVKYALESGIPRATATTTLIASLAYARAGTSTPAVYEKPPYPANILRPWLQDFDYGGNYGPTEVRAQIQAVYDAGLTSWMLWDPANRYTREALLPLD